MTENNLLLFAVAAIVAFVLLVLPWPGRRKRQRSNSKSNSLGKLRHTGIYRGVTIQRGKCAAIRHCNGRKFTFDDAPLLPAARHCAAPAPTAGCANAASSSGARPMAAGTRCALIRSARNADPAGNADAATPTGLAPTAENSRPERFADRLRKLPAALICFADRNSTATRL